MTSLTEQSLSPDDAQQNREHEALIARIDERNGAAIAQSIALNRVTPPPSALARASRHLASLIEAKKKRKDKAPIAIPGAGNNETTGIIGPNGEVDDEFEEMPSVESMEASMSAGMTDDAVLGMLSAGDSTSAPESDSIDSDGCVEPVFDIQAPGSQDTQGNQDSQVEGAGEFDLMADYSGDAGEFQLDPSMEVTAEDVKELNELLSSVGGDDEYLELLK